MAVEDNTSKNCVLGVFSYLISFCYDFLFSFLQPLAPNTLATRPLSFYYMLLCLCICSYGSHWLEWLSLLEKSFIHKARVCQIFSSHPDNDLP